MRAIADGLWVHEAPLRMLGVSAGRRMTVVRLGDGGLLVHSPAPLTVELGAALRELGDVRCVVPASLLHGHVSMGLYATAFPDAELFAAPGLRRRRRDLDFAGDLGSEPDPRWADVLDQTTFDGNVGIREVVFLHRASGSLIVGDVVWNVAEGLPLTGRLWAGARDGVRPAPLFRALTRGRSAARASIERILAWDFDRIVIGHGPMVEGGGKAALRAAYAWLL